MKTMEKNYCKYNAQNVLNALEHHIERGFSRDMRDVCDELSIFDWWTERLSVNQMKQMRTFLKNAIRLGYTGYVCFKVGASGCANGMWAHTEPTTTGYSPDCDYLYRSFSPDYTYWIANIGNKNYPASTNELYDSCKTVKQLEKLLKEI